MFKFIVKRFGYMLLTLFIACSITFFLIRLMPGDPLAAMGRSLPEQVRINYMAKYGLDKPLLVQYGLFWKNFLHGNLGESLQYPGRTVIDVIKQHAPISARVGGQGLIIGVSLGIVLGILAAFNRGKWIDGGVMIFAVIGISVPSFVMASLLQFIFAVNLRLFPVIGWGEFKHTVLPSLALSFGSIAIYARYLRANCLDVIGQDYILTAKAKGVSNISLVVKHIIRNAILPAITILGTQVINIFTGSIVVESMFSVPGLGKYYTEAILANDYSMVMGETVFITAMFIFAVFMIDILYSLIDPRIRLAGKR
ncbi:MAG: ABC transporter permease [Clostridioides sp.]|jgi:oligopeptide transport system permease protein|nr:ABC transporter permease [Clostridioides sp.]